MVWWPQAEQVRSLRLCRPAVSRRSADLLVDTSVAVALVVAGHEHHAVVIDALHGRRLGLAGHAAFETFSVLTRLPAPMRRTPAVVDEVLRHNFPATKFLPADSAGLLLYELAGLGVAGGSVYDALVGATARAYDLELATSDRRAVETYRSLGVATRLIE